MIRALRQQEQCTSKSALLLVLPKTPNRKDKTRRGLASLATLWYKK
jgi:hypothetical protein